MVKDATSDQWNIRTTGSHTLVSFGRGAASGIVIVDSLEKYRE
jgi:hypothetical protein